MRNTNSKTASIFREVDYEKLERDLAKYVTYSSIYGANSGKSMLGNIMLNGTMPGRMNGTMTGRISASAPNPFGVFGPVLPSNHNPAGEIGLVGNPVGTAIVPKLETRFLARKEAIDSARVNRERRAKER